VNGTKEKNFHAMMEKLEGSELWEKVVAGGRAEASIVSH
jgi:hypothetical protein